MNTKNIHSLLFVPSREKMLAKIATSDADAWIVDLEDSIPTDEKQSALDVAVCFLRESSNSQNCFVRIDRTLMTEQVSALTGLPFRGFMIPKTESCDFLYGCQAAFANKENIALVETPKGLIRLETIADCEQISAIAFGAEDYTASVNMQNSDENLTAIKNQIVMFAKAYGKRAYDTPSFAIRELVKSNAEAVRSASLGFDGKIAIHPTQILGINQAFGMHDMERMQKIVSMFEQQGGGVLVLDGNVYEKMHIARFKRILRENSDR